MAIHHHAATKGSVFGPYFYKVIFGTYGTMIALGVVYRENIAEFADNVMQRPSKLRAKRRERIEAELERIKLRKQEWELYSTRPYRTAPILLSAPHTTEMSRHADRNHWDDFLKEMESNEKKVTTTTH